MSEERTAEELRRLQSLPLVQKVSITQSRIMEWYQNFNGKAYVSFSGGKDSTVLLDIARKLYPDIPAVFCDTGLEFPEIRKFVKSFDNVVLLKPKMNFRQVIEKYGYPVISKEQANFVMEYKNTKSEKLREIRVKGNEYGRGHISNKWMKMIDAPFDISGRCCDVMKKRPAYKYEKETGNKPMVATMTYESSQRRSNWIKYGCNAFDCTRPKSQPMSFWTEQDVLEYITKTNIPICSVYGEIKQDNNGKYYTTGRDRTGCVFCGFGCHLEKEPNRFQRLKVTHPQLWDYCMKPWNRGGLGMQEVLDYIDVDTGADKKEEDLQKENFI